MAKMVVFYLVETCSNTLLICQPMFKMTANTNLNTQLTIRKPDQAAKTKGKMLGWASIVLGPHRCHSHQVTHGALDHELRLKLPEVCGRHARSEATTSMEPEHGASGLKTSNRSWRQATYCFVISYNKNTIQLNSIQSNVIWYNIV